MIRSSRLRLSILLVALTGAQLAIGLDYPLSPESIREAYFLGKQQADKREAFLKPYRHHLPLPESGPQVALIELQTPFTFIVDKVSREATGYHAQDAAQEFLRKPGHFRVQVEIDFTATYPGANDTAASLGDFWKDFQIRLKQNRENPPLKIAGRPIYSDSTISGYTGAIIDVDYDVKKVEAGSMATVEVETPDGQRVETTFDLAKLR
jgi:hypothetical protein